MRSAPALIAGADTGVGQDEVNPAQFGDSVGHDLFEPVQVADVAVLGDDATARLLNEIDGFAEIRRAS